MPTGTPSSAPQVPEIFPSADRVPVSSTSAKSCEWRVSVTSPASVTLPDKVPLAGPKLGGASFPTRASVYVPATTPAAHCSATIKMPTVRVSMWARPRKCRAASAHRRCRPRMGGSTAPWHRCTPLEQARHQRGSGRQASDDRLPFGGSGAADRMSLQSCRVGQRAAAGRHVTEGVRCGLDATRLRVRHARR